MKRKQAASTLMERKQAAVILMERKLAAGILMDALPGQVANAWKSR